MTLQAYSPEQLDELALRMLDVCAQLRGAARICREEGLPAVELHDRKALEWLENLEKWAYSTDAELHRRVQLARATRRAEEVKARG